MGLKKNNKKVFLKTIFENNIMIHGLKSKSENILFNSFKLLQKTSLKNYKLINILFLINNMPLLYLKKLKKKKKKKIINYIPYVFATSKIRNNFTLRLVIKKIRKNSVNTSFILNLEKTILNGSKLDIDTIESKKKLHEFIYLKRTFSHFRWF
jgi:ribosomal protein S7